LAQGFLQLRKQVILFLVGVLHPQLGLHLLSRLRHRVGLIVWHLGSVYA
jgi:hypothetical protein